MHGAAGGDGMGRPGNRKGEARKWGAYGGDAAWACNMHTKRRGGVRPETAAGREGAGSAGVAAMARGGVGGGGLRGHGRDELPPLSRSRGPSADPTYRIDTG